MRLRKPLLASALGVFCWGAGGAAFGAPDPGPLPAQDGALAPAIESDAPPAASRRSSLKRTKKFIKNLNKGLLRSALLPARPMKDLTRQSLMCLPSGRHLPRHLQDREHWDYPFPFNWIPRSWTSFGWGKPRMMLGNQVQLLEGSPKPIGERGSFQISRYPDLPVPLCWLPLYFAYTSKGGMHVRLGARWDDVDSYVQLPSLAIKRLD